MIPGDSRPVDGRPAAAIAVGGLVMAAGLVAAYLLSSDGVPPPPSPPRAEAGSPVAPPGVSQAEPAPERVDEARPPPPPAVAPEEPRAAELLRRLSRAHREAGDLASRAGDAYRAHRAYRRALETGGRAADRVLAWQSLARNTGVLDRYAAAMGRVAAIALSPDGERLAAGSLEGGILVWDRRAARLDRALIGNAAPVCALAFSPDGARLASGDEAGVIVLWDLATERPLWREPGEREIASLAFAPDGSWLASADWGASVEVRRAVDGGVVRSLSDGARAFHRIAVSAGGERLAAAAQDHSVVVWGSGPGEPIERFEGHRDFLLDLSYLDDGALAVLDRTGAISISRAGSVEKRALAPLASEVRFDSGIVLAASFRVATVEASGTCALWDLATGRLLAPALEEEGPVLVLAANPDGRLLAAANREGEVSVRGVERGTEVRVAASGLGPVVAAAADSGLAFAVGEDGRIRSFDLETGVRAAEGGERVRSLWASSGRLLAGDAGGRLRSLDFRSLEGLGSVDLGGVEIAAVAPGWAASRDGAAFRVEPSVAPRRLEVALGASVAVAVTPAGLGALARSGGRIEVVDLATGRLVARRRAHDAEILSLAASSDGSVVASSDESGRVRFWELPALEPLAELVLSSAAARAIAFADGDRRVVLGTSQGEVRIYELETPRGRW